ncbi:MAG: hypothetical protein FWD82_05215 [Defluviitaleaceae bacterium]|nr:hypothetical protein [Defluviitaleaceae bacterium]
MKKTICQLENIYLKSFPAISTHEIGGFFVNLSKNLAPKYNCYVPLNFTEDCDVEKNIAACEEFFYENNQIPVAKVLSNTPHKLSHILEKRGYGFINKYYVMELDFKKFHHRPIIVKNIHYNGVINDEIIDAYLNITGENKEAIYKVLYNVKKEAICAYYTKSNLIKGTAISAICEDLINIAYVESCETSETEIRQAVVDKILQKAHERKLSHAYVRVKSTNRQMVEMYQGLGFETVYSYIYRQKN